MAARYFIWLKDHSGERVALIDDFISISVVKQINGFDYHTLVLDASSPSVELFQVDYQLEVYRSDSVFGIGPTLEYEGFHRTEVKQTMESGQTLFTSYGRSYDDLLKRRAILYSSGTAGSNKEGPGETVMKAFVNENAGPLALTSNGRRFDGVIPGLSIQVDAGAGPTWKGGRAWRNLLQVLQEIAPVTRVDFKVVGTGPGTFEFRTKTWPWGDDRTNQGLDPLTGLNASGNFPTIFSIPFGNMERPLHSHSRIDEANAILVLGQGTGGAREVVERKDAHAITDSPWNRREITRQANTESTTEGLNVVGDNVLAQMSDQDSCTWLALQTPSTLYGRNYFLGDLVTAFYFDTEHQQQITQVQIDVKGTETIKVTVSPYATQGETNPLLERIQRLESTE